MAGRCRRHAAHRHVDRQGALHRVVSRQGRQGLGAAQQRRLLYRCPHRAALLRQPQHAVCHCRLQGCDGAVHLRYRQGPALGRTAGRAGRLRFFRRTRHGLQGEKTAWTVHRHRRPLDRLVRPGHEGAAGKDRRAGTRHDQPDHVRIRLPRRAGTAGQVDVRPRPGPIPGLQHRRQYGRQPGQPASGHQAGRDGHARLPALCRSRWPADSGLRHDAPGKPKGPQPTVVLVHGGPWVRGGSWEWDSEAQFLASRGYVVLEPEFRGSTGFGFKHFQAGWRQWGRTMQDDLADTAQWAIKQGWTDPKRVAIMGGSYGGYATLMGLIRHPELFRCGIDYFGVSDINLMFTSARGDFSEYSLRYDLRTLIGDPDKDAEVLTQNSPVALADKLKNPLLIAHGYEDRRVPIEHAQRLRSALGTPPEWVVYPNEGHGLFHENNRIDFYKRVERFLAKHLQ
ncbi:alpha/beta hydrolase family protein [Pseudoduganella armeniaca]|uniref:alpha/beta hydrolase family protein n=1 Tax=Pseudoduganella armeniaca TaxID=2072590 RepID=UPI0027D9046E|nr:prolyl oligopeptidase family serine peptidase [Pseudoduganella armeniaca]